MIAILISMVFSSLFWFSTLTSTVALIVYATVLYLLSQSVENSLIMSFLGITSIIHIVKDFNVGPTSDLKAYEKYVGIFPDQIWMYIWLMIVVSITTINLYHISKNND